MKEITLYENGQCMLGSDYYLVSVVRNFRLTPSQGIIHLYKNGEVYASVTEAELEKSGVVISNIRDFREILEITLNDNWGMSQYHFNLTDGMVHNMYNEWLGGEQA